MTTLNAFTPLAPNFTLPNTRLLLEVVISTVPLPLSAECCGLVVALSVSVSDALRAPSALGANVTPSVQLVLGATVIGTAPQVPVPLKTKPAADGVALEMTSKCVAPVFVTVTFLVRV